MTTTKEEPMALSYRDAEQALKDRLQTDPCGGRHRAETDDIEQALYWAGRTGTGYVADLVITCDPAGFVIARRAREDTHADG